MLSRVSICCISIACELVLLAGCRSSDDAAEPKAAAPAVVESASEPPARDVGAKTPAAAAAAPTEAVAQQPFAPPFPERLDLFEPPKRAQSAIRREDESGDSVELKGFLNVDGQKVVLLIGGVIAPLAEGEEKYGVQVKSISPPSVVLQRGRNRWTATLQ